MGRNLGNLLWGLIFLIVNPPFQAPDEPAHFFKMWGYTQGTLRHTIKAGWSGTELPESIERIYKFYSQYVYTNKKIPLIETVKYSKLPLNKDNKVFVKFIPTSYTPLSYFPSFIVLWVMKFLSIKPLLMMYILRFCSLLVYLSLTYFAIKITPCKKWLFLFFSLLPVNVYQAAAISTDGITLGVIMLFAAYTLKLAFDDSIVKIENMSDEEAAAAIVKDTVDLIRKQTRLVFEESKKTGEFTRDVARRLFTPDKSDTPDM